MLDKARSIGYRVHIMNSLTPEQVTSVIRIARTKYAATPAETKEKLKFCHDAGRWPEFSEGREALLSFRDGLLILLAYTHGLRASEVTNLRVTDINKADSTISIKRLKNSKHTTQKLRDHRGEPLLNEVRNLAEWMKIRPTQSGDALCPSAKGGCLTGNSFNEIFHKHAKQIGITLGPHSLKHSIATHLIRKTGDLALVQSHLGHVSISSTEKYLHLTSNETSDKVNIALMGIF